MERKWDREQWKRLLIDAFVRSCVKRQRAKVDPIRFEGMGELVRHWMERVWVQLGCSRAISRKQSPHSLLIICIRGVREQVVWSEAKVGKRMIRTEAENVEG